MCPPRAPHTAAGVGLRVPPPPTSGRLGKASACEDAQARAGSWTPGLAASRCRHGCVACLRWRTERDAGLPSEDGCPVHDGPAGTGLPAQVLLGAAYSAPVTVRPQRSFVAVQSEAYRKPTPPRPLINPVRSLAAIVPAQQDLWCGQQAAGGAEQQRRDHHLSIAVNADSHGQGRSSAAMTPGAVQLQGR